jgi:uncharacterized membrane protein YcaP (DUF421 family)
VETVIRVAIVYVFVMFGLRVVGKRTFGQLSPADLIVLMLIPEFFQQAVAREDFSMTNALIAVSALLLLVFVTELLSYRFPRLGKVLNGEPVTVVSHGVLRTDHMHPERLSPEEILDAMHRAGLERMEQVKWAVLYPDGTVAVVPWETVRRGNQLTNESSDPV